MASQEYVVNLVQVLTQADMRDVVPDAKLADLDWDSLCVLEYIARLDADHQIRVQAQDLANAATVADLIHIAQG